jgi:Zn-dependent protease with chaperone function
VPAHSLRRGPFGYTTTMELEKDVAARLAARRRRLLAWKAGITAALLAAVAALLVLVVVPYLAGSTHFTGLVKKTNGSSVIVGGAFALALLVVMLIVYLPGRFRTLRYFKALTARARSFDARALGRVMNALEGVASDAGAKAPQLAVLAAAVPNSLSFEGRQGAVIGITKGALEADIAYEELQALLAHELGSIEAGDFLRQPGSFKFEGLAYAALSVTAALGLMALAMVRAGNSGGLTLAAAFVVLGYLTAVGFMLRRLISLEGHDSVLADSIGAGITGRPDAMAGAIERMDLLVNRRRGMPFPESDFGLDYLFVQPYRWSEAPRQFLERRARELDYDLAKRNVDRRVASLQESMDELAERGKALLAARLENLQQQ